MQNNIKKESVGLICQMARSGGTLLNKCLGSMEDLVILSEVHPYHNQPLNLLNQAKNWFELLEDQDFNSMLKMSENNVERYLLAIKKINKNANNKHYKTIIRDWTHLDFLGMPPDIEPTYHLRNYDVLSQAFEVNLLFMTRHPIDQYLSSIERYAMKKFLNIKKFCIGYRKFAESIVSLQDLNNINIKVLKYENFVQQPTPLLKQICKLFQCDFDPTWKNKWFNYDKVSGDTESGKNVGTSRGAKLNEIKVLPTRNCNNDMIKEFQSNKDYQFVLEILNYSI